MQSSGSTWITSSMNPEPSHPQQQPLPMVNMKGIEHWRSENGVETVEGKCESHSSNFPDSHVDGRCPRLLFTCLDNTGFLNDQTPPGK
ncbi:unnamed protein product [Caretta caretta]